MDRWKRTSTLALLLETGEGHLGAGDVLLGVLEVGEQGLVVPDDARLLVGLGVDVAGDGARLATKEAVERGAGLGTTLLLNNVALQAAGLEELGSVLGVTSGDPF